MSRLRLKIGILIIFSILIQSQEASKLDDLFSQLSKLITPQRPPPFSDVLKICPRNPDVNRCIEENIEKIKSMLIKGIPELGIPSCEPLHLPKITNNQGMKKEKGKYYLQSQYHNIELSGVSQFTLISLNLNMTKLRLKFWIPEVQIKSNYVFKGRTLSQRFISKGVLQGNCSDIDIVTEMKLKNVTEVRAKVKIGDAEIHFSNFFDTHKNIGLKLNKALNENWKDVAEEIRPILEKSMANLIETYINRIFNKYPVDQLLPENPKN